MRSPAFKRWSGRRAGFACPTVERSLALHTNTSAMARTTLFAALEVATGLVHAGHYRRRRRREFLDFMNELVAKNPDKEIHVVWTNLNTHKPKQDRWLKAHPQVHFHFIPTRSSWLNQVECWFSILSRGALQGASFTSVKMLIEADRNLYRRLESARHPLRVDQRGSPPAAN